MTPKYILMYKLKNIWGDITEPEFLTPEERRKIHMAWAEYWDAIK